MVDHFERLGIPRRFSLDLSELNRRYVAQSRQLHPDFHGSASESEQAAAIILTATLNQAYTTLKDDFSRAEHLHSLLGGPTAAQEKGQDQRFLIEMMELRDQLDELRATNADVTELSQSVECRYTDVMKQIGEQLDSLPTEPAKLIAIRQLLNVAKTLLSVQRDIHGERTVL